MSNAFKILLICLLVLTTCKNAEDVESINHIEDAKIIKVLYENDIVVVASTKPRKHGFWGVPPTIILCEGIPYKTYRIEKAVKFWKSLGYQVFNIVDSKDSENFAACSDPDIKYIRRSIVIKLRGQEFDETKYALTTTYRIAETDEIVGVVIQVQNFATKIDWVLEHELGHAFGWKHFNINGHLMNAAAENGGWDTKGLQNKEVIDR